MSIGDGERQLHDFHQWNVHRVVADTCTLRCLNLQPCPQLLEGKHLVLRSLDDVLNAQLAAANLGHPGLSPRDHRHLDPGRVEALDALAIADMEHLQCLAARPEIEPSVRHGAIYVENKQSDCSSGFACHEVRSASAQTTPARNRSCTLSAPIKCPCASATGSAVMRCTSMMCTASAARARGPMVFGFAVITARMGVLWTSICLSKARLRSPSVNTPRMSSSESTTTVMPSPLRDISIKPAPSCWSAEMRGRAVPVRMMSST